MKHYRLKIVSCLAALLVASAAVAYDDAMAQRFAMMFEPVQGMKAGKELHLIKPEQLVQRIKQGEKLVPLDVRTPMELGIYGMTMPDTLAIPINVLFQPENLGRIPTEMPVLVVCATGTRATAAATALRFIGFDNVYVLKGGLSALAKHLDAKIANAPLPAPQ